MTEADWLAAKMLREMAPALTDRSARKRRLLAVTCVRQLTAHWDGFNTSYNATLDIGELFADDPAGRSDLVTARQRVAADARQLRRAHHDEYPSHYECTCRATAAALEPNGVDLTALTNHLTDGIHTLHQPADWEAEHRAVVALTRDIFGNPFRPIAFDPAWRTEAVVGLARGMYETRDFAPMPVLADALEDAGCADADVLAHCRSPGPHVRGCWVVDLVLGKA